MKTLEELREELTGHENIISESKDVLKDFNKAATAIKEYESLKAASAIIAEGIRRHEEAIAKEKSEVEKCKKAIKLAEQLEKLINPSDEG